MEIVEYPKWKYHESGRAVVVQSRDGEVALGPGWGDSPAGPFGTEETVAKTQEDLAPRVLADVTANPGSTAKEVADRVHLSEEAARATLEDLAASGQLEKARFGRYHPMPTPETPTQEE